MGHIPAAVKEAKRLHGFRYLLKAMRLNGMILPQSKYFCDLPSHPFRLEIPDGFKTGGEQRISFIGKEDDMKAEAMAFAYHLGLAIEKSADNDRFRLYLRIIYGESEERRANVNHLYFEFGYPGQVIICGGFPDFTITGRDEMDNLEGLFILISEQFDEPIQRTRIPFKDFKEHRETLHLRIQRPKYMPMSQARRIPHNEM